MITVLPLKNPTEISSFCEKYSLPFSENCGVTVARENDNFLGYCIFDIDSEKIVINGLFPLDDTMLADGILRSALHIADFRGINNAYYSNLLPDAIFERLDFIKNKEEKSLKIEKLHESSCVCQKNNK